MKKILFATLLFLAALSLQAQERMSYSMEIVAGAGFGRGPAALVTPQFVAQYELGGGLFIDPQIGYKISPRKAIALGVLIQQSTIMDKVSVETPTSSTVTATKNRYFTPAITLRYVILF